MLWTEPTKRVDFPVGPSNPTKLGFWLHRGIELRGASNSVLFSSPFFLAEDGTESWHPSELEGRKRGILAGAMSLLAAADGV